MFEKYHIASNRIQFYFSNIPYEYDESLPIVTIKKLSTISNIPIAIVRKDVATILYAYNNYHGFLPIYFSDYDDEINIPNLLCPEILAGAFDEEALLKTFSFNNASINIDFSTEELAAIYHLLNNQTNTENIKFKQSYNYYFTPPFLFEIIDCINFAINNQKQIFFAYRGKENRELSFHQVSPIKIIYSNQENLYSLLCIKRNTYIVYDFLKIEPCSVINLPEQVDVFDEKRYQNGYEQYIHVINQQASSYDKNYLSDKIPHVWKNAFSEKKAIHVKVKFSASCYEKVKSDLFYRHPSELLSEITQDNYFFFEDDIYGLDAFEMWIRSFGKNAIILEPRSLAEKRIKALKQELENYNQQL